MNSYRGDETQEVFPLGKLCVGKNSYTYLEGQGVVVEVSEGELVEVGEGNGGHGQDANTPA